MKNIIKKIIEDKIKIKSYIEKNKTLKGFKDDTITFSNPL